MPYQPPTYCKHGRCNKLVPYGQKYCSEHKLLHIDDRESASKRGYGSRWQKARKQFLALHPLCELCRKEGRLTEATVVDHIKPHRGDPVLFWDEENWQSLCKPCHDKKIWNEDANPEYRF